MAASGCLLLVEKRPATGRGFGVGCGGGTTAVRVRDNGNDRNTSHGHGNGNGHGHGTRTGNNRSGQCGYRHGRRHGIEVPIEIVGNSLPRPEGPLCSPAVAGAGFRPGTLENERNARHRRERRRDGMHHRIAIARYEHVPVPVPLRTLLA
mmetsp:Transcript_24276/g.53127  ORF Transcript_24276/g.53127 Transcript_24276/m.53127 type:complete len:150 (+) Transcript_24276:214-663(+)